jgi:hypothetical protein
MTGQLEGHLVKMIKETNEKYLVPGPFMHNELEVWKYDDKDCSGQDEFVGIKGGEILSFLLLDHLLQVVDVAGAGLYIQFGAIPD